MISYEKPKSKRFQDLSGNKYNGITVLSFAYMKKGQPFFNCKCSCGNDMIVWGSSLKTGNTKSCGCMSYQLFKTKMVTHGLSGTPIYNVWNSIKSRCLNENDTNYYKYGKLGVKVCDAWLNDFMAFYNWAIANGWEKRLNVCRKGDIGDYSPDNCYIATAIQNQRDRKSNKFNMWKARVARVMYNNHGWSVNKVADLFGVNESTVRHVLQNETWAQCQQ